MNARKLRTTVGTLAATALVGGLFVAAAAASSPEPDPSDHTITLTTHGDDDGTPDQGSGDALVDDSRGDDDDGTPDQGSGDVPRDHGSGTRPTDSTSTDDGSVSAGEDRAPRMEVREDDDRREVRAEVEHVGTETYDAAAAGTVTVTRHDQTLTISDVSAAAGWRAEVERSSGYEVEVTFRRDGQRVDFEAEIEHQWVKVRVRER